MDAGGRFSRPMTAGSSGRAGARAVLPRDWSDESTNSFFSSRKRRAYRKPVATSRGPRVPRFAGTFLLAVFFSGTALAGAWQGGQLARFSNDNGPIYHVLARAVGLGLDRVTISGISQLHEAEVLAAAGITPKVSLLFLNATEMREHLERVPLIKSAAVRKLYPNELVITLTEREPFAVWQLNGELFIVSADGTVIDQMQDERFAKLPLVVGENANVRIKEYLSLLESAGSFKSRIRAGTLVAGRRWTLKVDNGVDIRLPETGAVEALARLVGLERREKILEKDILAVDLRSPDRVVVRLSEEAAAARAEVMKKKNLYGVKGIQT